MKFPEECGSGRIRRVIEILCCLLPASGIVLNRLELRKNLQLVDPYKCTLHGTHPDGDAAMAKAALSPFTSSLPACTGACWCRAAERPDVVLGGGDSAGGCLVSPPAAGAGTSAAVAALGCGGRHTRSRNVLAALCGALWAPSKLAAALSLDSEFGLKERVTTSLTLGARARGHAGRQALLADVNQKINDLDVGSKSPSACPVGGPGARLCLLAGPGRALL